MGDAQSPVQNLDFRGLEEKELTKFSAGEWRLIVLGMVLLGVILYFTGQSQANDLANKLGIAVVGFGIVLGIVLEFFFKIRII